MQSTVKSTTIDTNECTCMQNTYELCQSSFLNLFYIRLAFSFIPNIIANNQKRLLKAITKFQCKQLTTINSELL